MSSSLTARIDASVLSSIVPAAVGAKGVMQGRIIAATADLLPELLDRFQVDTPLRIAHFLAQLAHESDSFCTTVEYATGAEYEGRADLGNIKSGDGIRFKGRGLIQLTGRTNYEAFTRWIRGIIPSAPDFVANPELVATFPWAVWSAIYFWFKHAVNVPADRDDLVAATKIVNGGRNGLAQRAAFLSKAKVAIATIAADKLSGVQQFPVLRRGMTGEAVEKVQRALAAAGHYLLSIDGDFGPGMETAVRSFQRAKSLTVDGMVGASTMYALKPFIKGE